LPVTPDWSVAKLILSCCA